MASAHTLPIAVDRCFRQGFFQQDDPGASGTLSFANNGWAIFDIVTAGAESRALDTATKFGLGTRCTIFLKTAGGALTITGADASVVLDTAGDYAEFIVADSGGTFVWRRLFSTTAAEAVDTETATASKTVSIPIDRALIQNNWRANDQAALAATTDTGDAALIVGAHGTSAPLVRFGTVQHATNTLDYATITQFQVPNDYSSGNLTLSLAITETTAASDPDLEVNAYSRDAPSVNLVSAGGDQDATGGGSFDVTLTGTGLSPGEMIDVRINLELTDSGTATPVYDLTAVTLTYTADV